MLNLGYMNGCIFANGYMYTRVCMNSFSRFSKLNIEFYDRKILNSLTEIQHWKRHIIGRTIDLFSVV